MAQVRPDAAAGAQQVVFLADGDEAGHRDQRFGVEQVAHLPAERRRGNGASQRNAPLDPRVAAAGRLQMPALVPATGAPP